MPDFYGAVEIMYAHAAITRCRAGNSSVGISSTFVGLEFVPICVIIMAMWGFERMLCIFGTA